MTASETGSPGAMLRQARTERGLSIDEVAQALRLSPRILSALEEDAYERLPGPTYVRGYLRSYAQFLDLSVHPLLEGFNNRPEASQRTEIKGHAPVRQATASDAVVRLASVAVAVVVFGLAALWWTGHDVSTLSGDAPVPTEGVFEPVPESQPAPEISDPVATVQARPLPAPAPAAATDEPPAVPPEPPAPAAEAPAPPVIAESPNPPAPQAPPAAASAAEPDARLARLVLYMHEDSWADVRDARGERLLYETIPAGRVVTVEGVAPLSVFLGNVRGVTVEFNGEEYNAARHRRGDVARFTLGPRSG